MAHCVRVVMASGTPRRYSVVLYTRVGAFLLLSRLAFSFSGTRLGPSGTAAAAAAGAGPTSELVEAFGEWQVSPTRMGEACE